MTSEIVMVPKEEYKLLIKCRHIVDAEFEEDFNPEFIQTVKESEEAYKKGEFVRVKSTKERKRLFDSL